MHIYSLECRENIQRKLNIYATSNLQSDPTSHMNNIVHLRGTKRFIIKLRMNIGKMHLITEQLNQLSDVYILYCTHNLSHTWILTCDRFIFIYVE